MLDFIFFIFANFLMCVFVAALLNVLIIATHQALTGKENEDFYDKMMDTNLKSIYMVSNQAVKYFFQVNVHTTTVFLLLTFWCFKEGEMDIAVFSLLQEIRVLTEIIISRMFKDEICSGMKNVFSKNLVRYGSKII